MKKFGWIFLFAAAASSALADADADKKAIAAFFAKYDAAMSRKDFATIRKMLAPGAIIVVDGQTFKALDTLKQSEGLLKSAKKITVKTTLTNISIKADTAVVKTSSKATMIFPDPEGKKKDAVMEDYRTATDTLVRIKGVWLMKKVESKPSKTLMNGKPLDLRPPTNRPMPSGKQAK